MSRFLKKAGTGAWLVAAGLAILPRGAGQNTDQAQTVTVEGCPVQGVENGCMIVKAKDGTVWEIGSAKTKPKVGDRAIRLTGRKSPNQASFCMQGTRLIDVRWTYTNDSFAQERPEK